MKGKKIPWLRITGVVLGILGAWMCVSGANLYRHFMQIDPVTLDGTVYHVAESYDMDMGESYEYYVSYTYEGKEYTCQYGSSSTKKYEEGDTVRVTVDKNNPEDTVSAVENNAMALGIFGSIFVGVCALVIPLHCTPKADGPYVKAVTERVAGRLRYRIMLITPLLLVLVFMNSNYKLTAVGAVLLCFGLYDTVRFVRDLLAAINGKLVLQKDRVIGQKMRQSEESLFCTLKLAGKRKYRYEIAKTVYSTYVKDETVTAIYLTGRKPVALADTQSEQIV